MAVETDRPVTRATIEAKLQEIRGEITSTTASARPYVVMAGVAAAVVLVGMSYLMGKRKGKKKTTLVEVRRV